MQVLKTLLSLWEHAFWSDTLLIDALRTDEKPVDKAMQEYAHVIGAAEVWLSRLEGRSPRAAVWPSLQFTELKRLLRESQAAWRAYLSRLQASDLESTVTYRNSAGREFTTAVGDILMQVVLHGHYHRGKVNLLLQQAGASPVPVDYIAFVRGAPAATRATSVDPGFKHQV